MIIGSKRTQEIKKAQKERLLFREISKLFLQLQIDDDRLHNAWLSKLELSPDKSVCYVHFYTPNGEKKFHEEFLEILKLYKPSMRKAIAAKVDGRYTPEIIFRFDKTYEKQERILNILDSLKHEE
jgi:ribosome-binding factor A